MHWNRDDEMLLLVLVLAPEASWIILCDHGKVLHHLFWASSGFVSCWNLSPCCGRPLVAPTLGRLWSSHKLSSRCRLDSGFVQFKFSALKL